MPDLRKYWADVNAIQRRLAEWVWLAPKSGGVLVETSAAVAARLLHSGSHREATEEEIESHRTAEDAARKSAFQDSLHRKGIAIIPISRDGAG